MPKGSGNAAPETKVQLAAEITCPGNLRSSQWVRAVSGSIFPIWGRGGQAVTPVHLWRRRDEDLGLDLHGCVGPGPDVISPTFDGVIFHVCGFF